MGPWIEEVGKYSMLMKQVFKKPVSWRMFFRELIRQIYIQGVGSIGIVMLISFFIGAVITIQLSINIETPLVPKLTLGYTAREIVMLEFSSTIMCMLLAGKCGSSIASEIGTMRVTEQLDAMTIMGVNPANYIILPKIIGLMLFVPFLVIISMFVGILGGYLGAMITPDLPIGEFIKGLQLGFKPYKILYSIIKSETYVFMISSLASYYGYYVTQGALEVGRASTKAVVSGNVSILVFDLILTQLLLT